MKKRQRTALFVWAAAVAFPALVLSAPRGASGETVRISGTGGAIESIRRLGISFMKSNPSVKIAIPPSMGSSGGIKAVLAGKLDVSVSARPLAKGERGRGGREIPYARTPFVFAVHGKTARSGVTRDEVLAIYEGKKTAWGDGSRIRLVLRPRSDSDIEALLAMWPEMGHALDAAYRREGMVTAMTDQDAADALEKVPGAFGTTTLSLVTTERRDIRILALDGVRPSPERLADGSYPHAKTFFLVTGANPPPAVRAFIAFIRSPAGASILRTSGQEAVP